MTDNQKGHLVLNRCHQYRHQLARLFVEVDGTRMGEVRDGSMIDLELSPGHHELRVRMSWCGSPPLAIDIQGGEVKRVDAFIDGGPFKTLYGPNRYYGLREVSQ